jgi:hypothetical protein
VNLLCPRCGGRFPDDDIPTPVCRCGTDWFPREDNPNE